MKGFNFDFNFDYGDLKLKGLTNDYKESNIELKF